MSVVQGQQTLAQLEVTVSTLSNAEHNTRAKEVKAELGLDSRLFTGLR